MKRKLSPEQIIQIPGLVEELGISGTARKFNVSPPAIRHIIDNEVWKQYGDEVGKPDRCPDCGSLVMNDMEPCPLCAARTYNKNKRNCEVLATL